MIFDCRYRTSTCSLDQLSMLSDFTLDTWVPNLRWMVAHRIHKKTPSYSTLFVSSVALVLSRTVRAVVDQARKSHWIG